MAHLSPPRRTPALAPVLPTRPSRRPLGLLVGLWLVVLALLFLALRQTPLPAILVTLGRLGLLQVLALVTVNLVILWMMSLRWWLLVRSLGGNVPVHALLLYRLAGFGISYFTPGPQFGGEPLQVHLLHQRRGVALPAAISSVFLDRLVDLLANFTFLMMGVLVVVFSGLVRGGAWNSLLMFCAALLLLPFGHLLALWQGKRPLTWLSNALAGPFPILRRATGLIAQSEAQIGTLCREKPGVLLQVIALSGLLWSVIVFEFWLTLRFLGLAANPVETVSALTAARLAFLLPLPGGLGALEAAQVMAAQLLGWGPAAGIALSLVIRARDVFLALFGLWVGGFAYRSVLFGGLVSKKRSS